MKHPPSCGCSHHRPPGPVPCPQPSGVLLNRIVACEKRVIPRLCTVLDAFGLPECVQPVRLQSIFPANDPPAWTILGECDPCGRIPMCVSIPLRLLLADSCGRTYPASAMLDVETWLPRAFADSWDCRMQILPSVQLLCRECMSCDTRFEVQLHVTLDLYLLRPEVFHMKPPRPSCPDLPLYPPPICH